MIPLQQVGDLRGVCKWHKSNSPWLSGKLHRSCHCISAKVQMQPAAGTSLLCSRDHKIIPTLPPLWWAIRLGSSSTAEIYCLQFHLVSTMSLPWVLISQVSADRLYTFFLVLSSPWQNSKAITSSSRKAAASHAHTQVSDHCKCQLLHLYTTYINLHLHTRVTSHPKLQSESCSSVFQSFCLLEPVAICTYWRELEMFLLLVIDLHSYCLWSWSILLKFQSVFFSPVFCTVSIAISLSVSASSSAGWLCFPYASVLLFTVPREQPTEIPPASPAPAWTIWQRWKTEARLSKTDSIPMTTTAKAVWWAKD